MSQRNRMSQAPDREFPALPDRQSKWRFTSRYVLLQQTWSLGELGPGTKISWVRRTTYRPPQGPKLASTGCGSHLGGETVQRSTTPKKAQQYILSAMMILRGPKTLTLAMRRLDLIVLVTNVLNRNGDITSTSRFHILNLTAGASAGGNGGDGSLRKGPSSPIKPWPSTFSSSSRDGSSIHCGSSTSWILLDPAWGCSTSRGISSSLDLLAGTSEFLAPWSSDLDGVNGSSYIENNILVRMPHETAKDIAYRSVTNSGEDLLTRRSHGRSHVEEIFQ